MIWFILGAGAGFLIGAIGMSLMQAASRADDSMEEFLPERLGIVSLKKSHKR